MSLNFENLNHSYSRPNVVMYFWYSLEKQTRIKLLYLQSIICKRYPEKYLELLAMSQFKDMNLM